YTIRVDAAGYQPVTQQVVLQESDMTVPMVMTRINISDEESQSRQDGGSGGRSQLNSYQCRKARTLVTEAKLTYAPSTRYRKLIRAESLCSKSPIIHYLLGNVLSRRGQPGDLDRALDHYRTVLRLQRDYPGVHERMRDLQRRIDEQHKGLGGVLKKLIGS
ncbi:MAG: tetratricopeptide repeat protein, partial [Mariprofundales bacterium]